MGWWVNTIINLFPKPQRGRFFGTDTFLINRLKMSPSYNPSTYLSVQFLESSITKRCNTLTTFGMLDKELQSIVDSPDGLGMLSQSYQNKT